MGSVAYGREILLHGHEAVESARAKDAALVRRQMLQRLKSAGAAGVIVEDEALRFYITPAQARRVLKALADEGHARPAKGKENRFVGVEPDGSRAGGSTKGGEPAAGKSLAPAKRSRQVARPKPPRFATVLGHPLNEPQRLLLALVIASDRVPITDKLLHGRPNVSVRSAQSLVRLGVLTQRDGRYLLTRRAGRELKA